MVKRSQTMKKNPYLLESMIIKSQLHLMIVKSFRDFVVYNFRRNSTAKLDLACLSVQYEVDQNHNYQHRSGWNQSEHQREIDFFIFL